MDFRELNGGRCVGRDYYRDTRNVWERLLQQFEALCAQLGREIRHSRHVAAGPTETRDKTQPHRVVNIGKHDRYRAGRLPRRLGRNGARDKDDVHLLLHKVSSQRAQALKVAFPKAAVDGEKELAEAQKKASQRKWDDVVAILSPVFAANRRMETGILLADAHLHKKKPGLAKEIIDTLEFDRELMSDTIKDILYRTGTALEDSGDPAGALTLYDIICNVDINYLDVFDRSDRLYSSRKKDG